MLKEKKVSALNSEILIKHKRIKWTPARKTLRLFPSQGDKFPKNSVILFTKVAHNSRGA